MKTLRTNSVRGTKRVQFGSAPGLLALCVLILYPLAALLAQTFIPNLFDQHMNLTPSLTSLQGVFHDKDNLLAVSNSFVLGLSAAVLSTIIGTVTAFAVQRAPDRLKPWLTAFVWIVFMAPSYVIAEGWLILMQDGGILAQLFALHNGWSAFFFTKPGLIVAMGLRYFPFVHFAMTQSIENMGTEFAQAGRILGATQRTVFFRVTLPLMAPAVLAGATISFAEGFGDFGFAAAITPQMHVPVITYQIYTSLSQAPVDYSAAAGLSFLLVLVTGGVLWLQMLWMKRRAYATVSSHSRVDPGTPRGRLSLVTWFGVFIAIVSLVLPVGATVCASLWRDWAGGIARSNWTLAHYATALHIGGSGIQALLESMSYALIAAIVTMFLGLLLSYQMTFRKSAATRLANIITVGTIAVPGLVLAAGFIFAWNAVWLIPVHLVLYGTPLCLAMAYIAGSLPYAIRLQLGAMSQLSPNLMTAAQVLGARQRTIARRIVLPLVGATAISTFFMTFTGTMFELPASSLLYPAGQPPFPVLIEAQFNAFEWSNGSALTIVGMVLIFAVYLFGQWIVMRLRRDRSATRFDVRKGTRSVGMIPSPGTDSGAAISHR